MLRVLVQFTYLSKEMAYNLEFEIVIVIQSQLIRTAFLSRRKNRDHDYFTVIVYSVLHTVKKNDVERL